METEIRTLLIDAVSLINYFKQETGDEDADEEKVEERIMAILKDNN